MVGAAGAVLKALSLVVVVAFAAVAAAELVAADCCAGFRRDLGIDLSLVHCFLLAHVCRRMRGGAY